MCLGIGVLLVPPLEPRDVRPISFLTVLCFSCESGISPKSAVVFCRTGKQELRFEIQIWTDAPSSPGQMLRYQGLKLDLNHWPEDYRTLTRSRFTSPWFGRCREIDKTVQQIFVILIDRCALARILWGQNKIMFIQASYIVRLRRRRYFRFRIKLLNIVCWCFKLQGQQ